MVSELGELDLNERDEIIASVQAAFGGVTRVEGAISWSECGAIDNNKSEEVCLAARLSDTDTHWSQLVDDPDWWPFPGIGGFAFINSEGFQYYLPPTMIRFLRGENEEWFPGHLLGSIDRFVYVGPGSPWTRDQLACIARFIAFMARHDECIDEDDPNPWTEALERRWEAFLT